MVLAADLSFLQLKPTVTCSAAQEGNGADTDECLLVTRMKQTCLLSISGVLTLSAEVTDLYSSFAFITANKIQRDSIDINSVTKAVGLEANLYMMSPPAWLYFLPRKTFPFNRNTIAFSVDHSCFIYNENLQSVHRRCKQALAY